MKRCPTMNGGWVKGKRGEWVRKGVADYGKDGDKGIKHILVKEERDRMHRGQVKVFIRGDKKGFFDQYPWTHEVLTPVLAGRTCAMGLLPKSN